jgi:Holliday junction DNA helicase RuvA
MIGRIRGTIVSKHPPQVLIDAHGVGYEVDVPMSSYCDLPEIGHDVTVLTHMVVREDAQLLYGFLTENERGAFRELIKISGVGPRIALAVLSGLSVDQLVSAVSTQQAGLLTRVPGIGKKTAERLILELKGRLGEAISAAPSAQTPAASDVLHALLALGYSEREANAAARAVPAGVSVSEGIRLALRELSR